MDSLNNDNNMHLYEGDTGSSNFATATVMLDQNTTTTTVDWSDHDATSSIFDATYTYSNDKYSCLEQFYHIHMALNYIIFISGIVCMFTRLMPSISSKYQLHAWSGRIYILSMLWTTAASLLINNDGLPVAVLVSFAAVMGGLTIGWIVIVIYKKNIHNQATNIVETKLIKQMNHTSTDSTDIDLKEMMNEATSEIVNSKTCLQRFFSLKSLHGILFFTSWMQISGRMFNKGDGEFACRTYPVYKPIDAPHIPDDVLIDAKQNTLKVVYAHDPHWGDLPWSNGPVTWSLLIIMVSLIMAIIGGLLFSFFFAWRAKRRVAKNISKGIEETTSTQHDRKDSEEILETGIIASSSTDVESKEKSEELEYS
jgi:hypothetical protein